MFLPVSADPGCPRQDRDSRKMVVCVQCSLTRQVCISALVARTNTPVFKLHYIAAL